MPGEGGLEGKVFLVTGATAGIGCATAKQLLSRGARVFLACRSEHKTRAVMKQFESEVGSPGEFLELDLGDLDSVRRCASAFLVTGAPLHCLINNAGLAMRGITHSGFELTFGVNHVGHFLLTKLLLGRIKESAPARIVTVASNAHYRTKAWRWDTVREPTASLIGMKEYSASKLANVLFSAELARRLGKGSVTTYSLHPGVVASDMWHRVPQPLRWLVTRRMISNEQGAVTTLHCATSPDVARETGLYYDNCEPRKPSRLGCDDQLAKELWERTEEWVA